MRATHHVLSDVGRKRKSNEDSFHVDAEHGLYVVADGMGGHAAGEVASKITVEVVGEFVAARWVTEEQAVAAAVARTQQNGTGVVPVDPDQTAPMLEPVRKRPPGPSLLKAAIAEANMRVLQAARDKREQRGMASTVVAALLDDDVVHLAHAGDSRIYRLRGGALELLTRDRSWVGEQIASGALSAAEARTHPLRNMVTRAVGGRGELDVDTDTVAVMPGDTLVLCSDGLTGMVPDAEIARIAGEAGDVHRAVERLVEEANERGGHDNITVLMVLLEDLA